MTDFPYYGIETPSVFPVDEYLHKPGAAFVGDGDEVHVFAVRDDPEHEERMGFILYHLLQTENTVLMEYI